MEIRMPAGLTIRPCAEADLMFVHDLTQENMEQYAARHRGGWQDELFWPRIDKGNITILERSGRNVAFFDVTDDGDALHVDSLQVCRDEQGRGIGSLMLALIEGEAGRRGFSKIRLSVFVDNPAQELYLRQGYRVVAEEGCDKRMEKLL